MIQEKLFVILRVSLNPAIVERTIELMGLGSTWMVRERRVPGGGNRGIEECVGVEKCERLVECGLSVLWYVARQSRDEAVTSPCAQWRDKRL